MSNQDRAFYRQQLRLQIGAEAFDSLPERELPRKRRPVQRRPRIEAWQAVTLSGVVPARIAAGFTMAETAVLCFLARMHQERGRCDLTVGAIGYGAEVCRTIVQRTLRKAEAWDLIHVDRRRITSTYNAPSIITIVSKVWLAWLRLGPRRPRLWGGAKWVSPYERRQQSPRRYQSGAHECVQKPSFFQNYKSASPLEGTLARWKAAVERPEGA